MTSQQLIDAVEAAMASRPPIGISAEYIAGFFFRNRKALMAMADRVLAAPAPPAVTPPPALSGIRISVYELLKAIRKKGDMPGLASENLETRTITAAFAACLAEYGVRPKISGDGGKYAGHKAWRITVDTEPEAQVLTAFWGAVSPVNGSWMSVGYPQVPVEMAGRLAMQFFRLAGVQLPLELRSADEWEDYLAGHVLYDTFMREKPVYGGALTHRIATRLLWAVGDRSAPVFFRVAEDGTFADLADDLLTFRVWEPGKTWLEEGDYPEAWLVHPAELSAADVEKWVERFYDYQLIQPWPQLARPVDRDPPEFRLSRLKATVLNRHVGANAPLQISAGSAATVFLSVRAGRIHDVSVRGSLSALTVRQFSELLLAFSDLTDA